MKRFVAISLLAGLNGLSGCSAPPAAKDPSDAGTSTATSNEAEDAFERAERDLHALLLAGDGAQGEDGPEPKAETGINGGRQRGPSRCTRACRALSSMQRSAARLCELSGDEDNRCKSVQLRVDAAEKLVTSSCPTCSVK